MNGHPGVLRGRHPERLAGPALFDDTPADEATPHPPADPAGRPPAGRGHGRRRKPAVLPREQVEEDLSDAETLCPCCNALRVRFGQEVAERLDYRPASLFVREIARSTYACRACERAGHDPRFAHAALPHEMVPRGGVGSGLLAQAVVAKFVDHLPLHRRTATLARDGWPVPRSTLCDHLQACGRLLTPLHRLMADRVRASHAIHADETPVVLLRPRRSA